MVGLSGKAILTAQNARKCALLTPPRSRSEDRVAVGRRIASPDRAFPIGLDRSDVSADLSLRGRRWGAGDIERVRPLLIVVVGTRRWRPALS